MDDKTFQREGSCRCGRVRLRVDARPLVTMACHCTGCQKMSSSAYSLSAAIPAQSFAVVEGEPVAGGLHGQARHMFCPHCMSWMFTRIDGMDWFVNVRTTMLDDPASLPPFIESWTAERLPFAQTGAPHSYAGFPPMEDFGRLMEEYRGWEPVR